MQTKLAAEFQGTVQGQEAEAILHFTGLLKKALHNTFRCRRSTPYSNMLPHSPHVLFLGVGTGKGHGTWPARPA